MKRILAIVSMMLLTASCVKTTQKDYSTFYAERPRSILIVPVVNNTVDVDAPLYFLSTVTIPLAERGYYTFPINLVRAVMQEEGLSDANLVHQADPTVLGGLFGADAILYITIEHWETVYIVLAATTTVSFKYAIKSARTGETLWKDESTVQYTPGSNSGGGVAGLVAMAVAAAIQKAAPNYMPLAQQANRQALWVPGKGVPVGPYHGEFGKDAEAFPGSGAAVTASAAAMRPAPPVARKESTAVSTPAPLTAPNAASASASVQPGTSCPAAIHIDIGRDRRSLEESIADYVQINGIGWPYPTHKIEKFRALSMVEDNCGKVVVRAELTLGDNRRMKGKPDQVHDFYVERSKKGLTVAGCKTC